MNRMTALIVVQVITLIVGFGALIYAVKSSQSERENARRDTCVLIVGLARAAAGPSHRALAEANAYIARTQLHDCNAYAHNTGARKHGHTRK